MADTNRAFPELLDALGALLEGDARARIIDGVARRGSFDDQLRRLRASMAAHTFAAGDESIDLAKPVRRLDNRTRQDGFRVLHAWDHKAHRFTEDIVPVLLLDFYQRARRDAPDPRVSLQILLDYYFVHLLALCAMRIWDAADPDGALERLTTLLETLQGDRGSGHRFVVNAETLLIYALSQFHPEEQAYDRIIERVVTLEQPHQLAFAEASAAVLSAHLRWGFWLMYGRDVVRMRADNVGDYPWLLNSVLTLLRGYAASLERGDRPRERASLVGALLQGLAADPWAFTAKAPPALAAYETEYAEVRDLLGRHGLGLLDELERHRPRRDAYSPLALHFNFPHNTLVAIVTLALLQGKPQPLTLNALFAEEETAGFREEAPASTEGAPTPEEAAVLPKEVAALPEEAAAEEAATLSEDAAALPEEAAASAEDSREMLARTLMAFSRSSPDRLGYRGAMLVAYDPLSGMRSFSMTTEALRKTLG